MIQGIPYFGEDTQEITNHILNCSIDKELNVDSLYKFVNDNIENKIVVVIDNKWLTWLNDITFNYRDKECYIPYFTYMLYETTEHIVRNNNKGHLVLNEDTLCIRYNYSYNKLVINLDNLSSNGIVIYDLEKEEKILIKTSSWINEEKFDIEKLYNLYIESAFKEDDFLINKHNGGYHYIYRSPKQFKNKERQLREEYDLANYDRETLFDLSAQYNDYRDVRNYKYEEIIRYVGLVDTSKLYNIRRLQFESYLYCILREHLISNNEEFNNRFKQLGKTKEHIKYGKKIKFIFKSYWLDEYKPIRRKSWTRI